MVSSRHFHNDVCLPALSWLAFSVGFHEGLLKAVMRSFLQAGLLKDVSKDGFSPVSLHFGIAA